MSLSMAGHRRQRNAHGHGNVTKHGNKHSNEHGNEHNNEHGNEHVAKHVTEHGWAPQAAQCAWPWQCY